jgi:hypothetical protein
LNYSQQKTSVHELQGEAFYGTQPPPELLDYKARLIFVKPNVFAAEI